MANITDLETLFLTFNCGREPINTNYFAASILEKLSTQLPPDLIVLSLQEIAPISYSFLGGSFLAPYLGPFAESINQAARSWNNGTDQYETVLASNLGMTAIILLAKPEVAANIKWIETGGTGVGLWEMGNKGAVGARLGYAASDKSEEVALTFVAAHLAPMEEDCERRNQDWKNINENLVFGRIPQAIDARIKAVKDPSEETEPLLSSATDGGHEPQTNTIVHTLISDSSYTFFGGDLNYRTSDIKPHPDDHLSWPKRDLSPTDSKHYSHLRDKDQLDRERSSGRTLHHLTEAPFDFAPTYKYSSKAQGEARRAAEAMKDSKSVTGPPANPEWAWAEHRHPSWCDRVLYLDPPYPANKPKVHAYTSLPLQPTSDHQPVALSVSIPLTPLPKTQGEPWVSSPFSIRPKWAEHRAAARRKEVFVGTAAYLSMTWEGRALVLGTVLAVLGAWAALSSLLVG